MTRERDPFPTSQAARRMLERVSPVYMGPVANWLFVTMGVEWDEARAIFGQLPLQAFPETATWGLNYWEQLLHIPNKASGLEERRREVLLRRDARAPMNPARIAAIISGICGREVDVVENAAPYTFAVWMKDNDVTQDYQAILAMLRRVKPSHQQFWLVDRATPGVLRNQMSIRLDRLGFALHVSNQPGGDVIVFDGQRKFDGTWRFHQAFRGVEMGQAAFTLALKEREQAAVCGLSLHGSAARTRETAALRSASVAASVSHAGRTAHRRTAWRAGVRQWYGLSGALVKNSMWRFDGSAHFDGGWKWNAAIIKEEI